MTRAATFDFKQCFQLLREEYYPDIQPSPPLPLSAAYDMDEGRKKEERKCNTTLALSKSGDSNSQRTCDMVEPELQPFTSPRCIASFDSPRPASFSRPCCYYLSSSHQVIKSDMYLGRGMGIEEPARLFHLRLGRFPLGWVVLSDLVASLLSQIQERNPFRTLKRNTKVSCEYLCILSYLVIPPDQPFQTSPLQPLQSSILSTIRHSFFPSSKVKKKKQINASDKTPGCYALHPPS